MNKDLIKQSQFNSSKELIKEWIKSKDDDKLLSELKILFNINDSCDYSDLIDFNYLHLSMYDNMDIITHLIKLKISNVKMQKDIIEEYEKFYNSNSNNISIDFVNNKVFIDEFAREYFKNKSKYNWNMTFVNKITDKYIIEIPNSTRFVLTCTVGSAKEVQEYKQKGWKLDCTENHSSWCISFNEYFMSKDVYLPNKL